MLDRSGPLRTALAAAGAVVAPAAAAASPPAPSVSAPASAGTIGGAQLAGRGVIVNYSPGIQKLPGIKASAWVIADAGTGQVLAAKNPHGWFRPASTLKVLTAISLIPVLNPDATTVASRQATSVPPNIVGLLAGHAYPISDLFTALLTISANDAAVALTQATGSYARGMAVINAEARHLQAGDTVAVTPNGLDAPGQHTS
jgi:D-alanyl-D-alanine carboxypeptidase (penicillin-binding protein 5/6)